MLIAKQPDFGTAFLLLLIFFTIMMTARLRLKTLVTIVGVATIAAFPIYQHLMHEYQRKRVEAFFNPNSDGAYQARQALNAIGSGRFFGKGFMHGTQIRLRHFPALWTDFPFAVWAEEWGFAGCAVLLLAYLVLILWILKIAGEARDRFGATVCVGVAAMIFWHVVINIGMVSGTLPVVGVTLPLISYGGSSILTTVAALGPGDERQRPPVLVLAAAPGCLTCSRRPRRARHTSVLSRRSAGTSPSCSRRWGLCSRRGPCPSRTVRCSAPGRRRAPTCTCTPRRPARPCTSCPRRRSGRPGSGPGTARGCGCR